jgi:ATP-dependent DNA ligase
MPFFQPMPLGRKAQPFDRPEWIYELKYDGFRALAVVEYGRCALFSRNGHPFASFSELASRIGYALMPRSVVLDGKSCAWIKMDDASSMTCYSGVATRASLHSTFSKLMGGTYAASA